MIPLELAYSHNVIEHLGLKLYQNRPTNVMAELVANSWDANAGNVWIDLCEDEACGKWIGVADNGHGMSHDDLATKYLVIGAPKRNSPSDRSLLGKRRLMGRKGIGKLAPFGIADMVDVITVFCDGNLRSCVWIRMDLGSIKRNSGPGGTAIYQPEVLHDGELTSIKDLSSRDDTGQVASFFKRIINGSGTEEIDPGGNLVKVRPKGEFISAWTVRLGIKQDDNP